jgi:hypothetical protein
MKNLSIPISHNLLPITYNQLPFFLFIKTLAPCILAMFFGPRILSAMVGFHLVNSTYVLILIW